MFLLSLPPVLGLMAVSKASTKSLQKAEEGPCWGGMWPFLDPWDVVGLHTTGKAKRSREGNYRSAWSSDDTGASLLLGQHSGAES